MISRKNPASLQSCFGRQKVVVFGCSSRQSIMQRIWTTKNPYGRLQLHRRPSAVQKQTAEKPDSSRKLMLKTATINICFNFVLGDLSWRPLIEIVHLGSNKPLGTRKQCLMLSIVWFHTTGILMSLLNCSLRWGVFSSENSLSIITRTW